MLPTLCLTYSACRLPGASSSCQCSPHAVHTYRRQHHLERHARSCIATINQWICTGRTKLRLPCADLMPHMARLLLLLPLLLLVLLLPLPLPLLPPTLLLCCQPALDSVHPCSTAQQGQHQARLEGNSGHEGSDHAMLNSNHAPLADRATPTGGICSSSCAWQRHPMQKGGPSKTCGRAPLRPGQAERLAWLPRQQRQLPYKGEAGPPACRSCSTGMEWARGC